MLYSGYFSHVLIDSLYLCLYSHIMQFYPCVVPPHQGKEAEKGRPLRGAPYICSFSIVIEAGVEGDMVL